MTTKERSAQVTEARIPDLLATACAAYRERGAGFGWSWTKPEALAFDLFLVRTGDALGFEAGTPECRFRARVRRMVEGYRVRELPEKTGRNDARLLHCYTCGENWSANRADYFLAAPDKGLTCCGEPLTLALRRVSYAAA